MSSFEEGDPDRALAQRMQVAYNQLAPAFAQRNAQMPEELATAGREMLTVLSDKPLLDVGCGAGRDMAWFEARGATVVGVDLSQGMLAQARPIVQGALAQMNMCQLAFADRTFQCIWCCAALLHLPKKLAPRALGEFRRILPPGGWLMVAVQAGADEQWERSYVPGVERFFARYHKEEMAALLAEAGFQVRRQSDNSVGSKRWLRFFCRRK